MKRKYTFEDAQKGIKGTGTPVKLTDEEFDQSMKFFNYCLGLSQSNVQNPVLAQEPAEPPYPATSAPDQDEVS
jgi:hypothetical protein